MRLAVVVAMCALAVAATGVGSRATPMVKPVPARDAQLAMVGRFEFPVHLTAPAGDTRRLFVVEKAGRIRVVLDGRTLTRPFLDIAAEIPTGNETGLLSLAFSPDYRTNGLFYVYYVGTDRRTHLLEFRRSAADPNRADPRTRRQVLSFVHLSGEHFGGMLSFAPDRRLYLSTGDGGLTEWQDKMRAQRLNDVNGKILRVNPSTGATRVVVRGLRNPWRYWFDEKTRDLYVGDAGEYVLESIDYAPAARVQGANFGWPCFEGHLPSATYPRSACPGARRPLHVYAREGGNCTVIGGVVVRDPRLPLLAGRYLYADFCLGEILVLRVQNGRLVSQRSLRLYQPGITSFGVDGRRRVYVTTFQGTVYRLDPAAKGAVARKRAASSGKELFFASGCGTCHALAKANAVGAYGPNLDSVRPSRERVIDRVTWGKGLMPPYKGRLTDAQIRALAEFVAAR